MNLPRGLALVIAGGVAPALARWAVFHEKRILREGGVLPGRLMDFASELGISSPDGVRVMEVDRIPLPVSEGLLRLGKRLGFPVFAPIGMTLGRGIYLVPGHESSLPHELVHVLQYQRLGISRFMEEYVGQCLAEGYSAAPLECEAREKGG